MKQIWYFVICMLNIVACYSLPQSKSLTINLISYRNGVGLDQDIDLLTRELTQLGHHVELWNHRNLTPRPKVDINIFIEVVKEYHFQFADQNYFLINPEWYLRDVSILGQFDKILCKTKEAERILKQFNPNAVFMSFTCEDRYDAAVIKNYRLPLHLAGASMQKNTKEVVAAWRENSGLPPITIIKHRGVWEYPPAKNINLIYDYLSRANLNYKQNHYGMHICPSTTEGFGHYIAEALSCADVVVTLDAPPMNELVHDQRCLVKPSRMGRHGLANIYYVDPDELARTVENLLSLPEEELKEIGNKNREFYLENSRVFKKNLAEIF